MAEDVHTRIFGSRKLKAKTSKIIPVTSSEYLQQKSQHVPAEEWFIYKYLQKQAKSGKKSKKDDFDMESVTSEDFQKLLDGVCVLYNNIYFPILIM